jgi:phage tail-like protein
MPRFEQSELRDPYRNFKYRIWFGGVEVAACRKMSTLDATVNTVKFRAGNNPSSVDQVMPGRVEYQPVTFESGMTNDDSLERWANELIKHDASDGARVPEPNFRRLVEILVMDIDGTPVKKYVLHDAFPTKYSISELDASGNDVLIETLELTHHGFERVDLSAG